MGVPDSSLLDLIEKVRSWISWGKSDRTSLAGGRDMDVESCKTCCECKVKFTDSCLKFQCPSCSRVFCRDCVVHIFGSDDVVASGSGESGSMARAVVDIKTCKFCSDLSNCHKSTRKFCDKVYPSESPRESPEPPSPSLSSDMFDGDSTHDASKSSFTAFSSHPSPVSLHHSPSRSDEDEGAGFTNQSFSPSSDFCHDTSDLESSSVSARHKFYHLRSFGSSPSHSPSRIRFTSNRVGHSVQDQHETPRSQNNGPFDQETLVVLGRLEKGNEDPDDSDNLSVYRDQLEKQQKPLDFENNGRMWFPPPPDDEDDETQNNFFTYDDDDDEIGETGATFSSSGSLSSIFPAKDKQQSNHKEPLQAVVHGHFRALVLQLLQGEDIHSGKESAADDWIDIVTSLAWQAANYVKPDTSKGGSMDPVDYVKVKCIASGTRSESTLVKGVVCTKNIKHKRMTSQYKNARLLILGGALEYQRAANQLASFDTLLQQEKEQLKMIVSRIEAHHPNVLLVEKSVSSYAQELLLAKEISLVLNVKAPLLERVSRCTGALITPSIDNIATTRLGHCELFHLEKVSEEHEHANQLNKKPSKTLMFFDGCARRLGCTVLLRGSCREELKKLKKVVQYAVFAAYHLSLETSFLADEGASLPKVPAATSIAIPERTFADHAISVISQSSMPARSQTVANDPHVQVGSNFNVEAVLPESLLEYHYPQCGDQSNLDDCGARDVLTIADRENLALVLAHDPRPVGSVEIEDQTNEGSLETSGQEESQPTEIGELSKLERSDETKASNEVYSAADNRQSILVSFSSRCVLNGTVCVRSRLLRIKFYGSFDKPLGRYLLDDLFGQMSSCQSCKEPAEAHVICYTHQQANLTINVRRLPLVNSLPGERDKKIWMWHRCLKCAQIGGVPPATRRVIMSDAAWGLSFGKFLELSFSNHATANRVASCGHSLQRDCLRYYGCGSMVAFFRYSPIDILSVRLPPLTLEFCGYTEQEWLRKEAAELLCKAKALYAEISSAFRRIEDKSYSLEREPSDTTQLHDCILELKDLLMKEKNDYQDFLQLDDDETFDPRQGSIDILELNRLRHSLVIASHVWDRRLLSIKSFLQKSSGSVGSEDCGSCNELIDWRRDMFLKNETLEHVYEESLPEFSDSEEYQEKALQSEQEGTGVSPYGSGELESSILTASESERMQEMQMEVENAFTKTSLERAPSAASVLSDQIDFAWSGTDRSPKKAQLLQGDGSEAAPLRQPSHLDLPSLRRIRLPARVHSFDSAMRLQDRIRKGLPPSSLHLSSIRSFHASGDYKNMIRDPVSSVQRTYSQMSPSEAHKFNLLMGSPPLFISYASLIPDGSRLMVPHNGHRDVVLAVYDNEPTSVISYALCSKVYNDWVTDKSTVSERSWITSDTNKESGVAASLSAWQSFGSLDMDYIHYGSYGSEDASSTITSLFTDSKSSPHLRISFDDESSSSGGKVKFSVTCYFAKQFDALRRKCCPDELDFVRSLSRCKRWSAQGGKSNVYFAKSLDERFIIKQVQKTELDSFEEFAPEYFKYLTHSINSRSPTCLAKILGIFQVSVKHLKGGRETKMDLIVMENLFFERKISRVYDLKGSLRSRYNADTTGANKVLLDMNLLETLHTKPIFLGGKAKRSLERAVWNDTSFLASVDVMDYSLLVGVDEERKELVLGIIDFMRQYTWDKHLETWVKASGILGGPKNASPTIVSPKQYKKRFRKAMTTYFLTVPDQWSS
ncbi:putative 1-phosphatidylinositol-3-phosphate 5-kinase FAB1C [Capsicum annuum]|uniref:putative 1-phosphatidylinositol-3-phosphate 5-kinase FAB1C n=1 Tax=Capsicum annuum TaxID=4072 RepID=UPI0007BEE579|nr:putative 1-phosphatidylinositol-3-phosphate 5-kinase FAB1C [Capsicum annuum]KAF3641795.1 putative 1-phosphatidylinositol-3-phosphate 5-kinase FAB1C [Capsicum annuum]